MSLLTERGRLCGTFGYKHAAPPEPGQVNQVCHYPFSLSVKKSYLSTKILLSQLRKLKHIGHPHVRGSV